MLLALRTALIRTVLLKSSQNQRITYSSIRWTTSNAHLRPQDWAKIHRLIQTAKEMVEQGSRPEKVNNVIHRTLDRFSKSFDAPHKVYEPLITQLIGYECFDAASTVYERMLKNGLVPSVDLDAQMLAVATALSPDNVTLLSALDNVFTNPSFTEDSLLRTLQAMLKLGTTPNVVLNTIERFLEAKSEDYTPGKLLLAKLVELQVRNDKLEDALESLQRFDEKALGDKSQLPPQFPYVTIMAAIRDTELWNEKAVKRVLWIMEENGVEPSIALFNILISGEVRAGNLDYAFSIYAMLKALKTKDCKIIPDVFTFGTLFNARGFWSRHPALREDHTGENNVTNSIPSLRRLFYEMTETYQSQNRDTGNDSNPTVNTRVLNVALKAFLREQDYPAAFVVVRTFGQLKQEVDVKTYYNVMKHIMNRVRRDIKRVRMVNESRWGDRFLGVSSHQCPHQIPVDEDLARKVLAYGRQTVFDLRQKVVDLELNKEATPSAKDKDNAQDGSGPKRGAHLTPTLEMMDGDEPVPPNVVFSLIPLKRILKRAVLANLMDPSRGSTFRPDAGRRYYEWKVLNEIQQAEREMVSGR